MCSNWVINGPWYNVTISQRLRGVTFEEFYNINRQYIDEMICEHDAHENKHDQYKY